ncbi:MAG: aminotransferase class III-fold pyridoxal phosphate-dependent enzyme [Gammaproteobacteria bacterium]|nr:aminotransferase class III-fold pyridoxal phosphate-dependent enzyme [Gammaproteobacteria bacterium]
MTDDTLDTAPPAFTPDEASQVAVRYFGQTGRLKQLGSERDQNFHLSADDEKQYVLKFANPAESPQVVDLQVRALRHVAGTDPTLPVPRVCSSVEGTDIVSVSAADGTSCLARMVSFLPGTLLGDAHGATARLQQELGSTLAQLGRALRGYFHPAARHELLWDLKNARRLREFVDHIPEERQRRRVAEVLDGFEAVALPVLPGLRAQVIHNDFNPGNVLVDEKDPDQIAGVIDFGDLVHSPLVVDLAVAAAYQLAEGDDPLGPVTGLVSAYHQLTPLEEIELAVLFDLIATRVATTVAISSWRAARYPGNREYILTSNPKAVRLLDLLAQIPRDVAIARFREACELPSTGSVKPKSTEALVKERNRLLGPAYRLFYDKPLHAVRGNGVWLYDAAGQAYLDAYNNVPHVGHCHPRVVNEVSRQMAVLNTHTRYLHESILDYSQRLGALFPFDDPVCLYCCTGSEANELAYRIAQAHAGATGVVVTDHAYHGNTSTVAQFSTADTPPQRRGAFVQTIAAPDSFRGAHRYPETDLAEHFAAQVKLAVDRLASHKLRPAMLLVDTIFSCDGVVTPPHEFLQLAAQQIRNAGGLFVADEVQAGFGRTGEQFWGFERYDVVPDIVTVGKPMGNGFPLAAVITTRRIIQAFAGKIDYFNTFGGSPVACAAGLAVLDVIEAEDLQQNAQHLGNYLTDKLREMQQRYDIIGDVRGSGLFIGVELVRDCHTLQPAGDEARHIVNAMRDRGVLIGATGPRSNVLKIRPPMVFSRENADQLLDTLASAI